MIFASTVAFLLLNSIGNASPQAECAELWPDSAQAQMSCLEGKTELAEYTLFSAPLLAISAIIMGIVGSVTVTKIGKQYDAQLKMEQQSGQQKSVNEQPPLSKDIPQPRIASTEFDLQMELKKAAKMLQDGLIEEDEYKALKKRLIEKS